MKKRFPIKTDLSVISKLKSKGKPSNKCLRSEGKVIKPSKQAQRLTEKAANQKKRSSSSMLTNPQQLTVNDTRENEKYQELLRLVSNVIK
jgi:hypothetical protein